MGLLLLFGGGVEPAWITNTYAPSFDVRYRYFAACEPLEDVDLTNYTGQRHATPTDWTIVGDTITPPGDESWVEVTSRIAYDGTFTQEWTGAQVDWSCSLHGWHYDDTYFAVGYGLVCFVRIERLLPTAYDSGWMLEWLGTLETGGWTDNYIHGMAWRREVKSVRAVLETLDAPRLRFGKLDITSTSTVSASSTLATPSDEAGNGEFSGSTANVQPDNVLDGRQATVWISQDAPTVTGEVPVEGVNGAILVDEVFMWPAAGWTAANTWWIELFNSASTSGLFPGETIHLSRDGWWLMTLNSGGNVAILDFGASSGADIGDDSYTLEAGERAIICANMRTFESYTGGAHDCKFVVEARSWQTFAYNDPDLPGYTGGTVWLNTHRLFDLAATNGYVVLGHGLLDASDEYHAHDAVLWGAATPPDDNADTLWTGAGIDVSGVADGHSIRRKPSGTDDADDGGRATDWAEEAYPHPGSYYEPGSSEWLQVELPEETPTLTAAIITDDTVIPLTDTSKFAGSGTAICEGDTFTYTGKTPLTLTGVTGLSADHADGALVYPYEHSEAQTGWRVEAIDLERRYGLSTIKYAELWTSPYADCGTPAEAGWQLDYNNGSTTDVQLAAKYWDNSVNGLSGKTFDLTDYANRWVRTVLVRIHEMSDAGRAKLNSITIVPEGNDIADTGLAQIGSTAADIADYIASSVASWLPFTDNTDDGYAITRTLETAIEPLPGVLEDLARQHGALVSFTVEGGVDWDYNYLWSHAILQEEALLTLSANDMRGEVQYQNSRPACSGVAINSVNSEGLPWARIVWPPAATGSTVKEFTGYVIPGALLLPFLASQLYYNEIGTARVTWTIKGIGEWCEPAQALRLYWDSDNDGTEEHQGAWLIERVQRRWRMERTGKKQFATALTLRSYHPGTL